MPIYQLRWYIIASVPDDTHVVTPGYGSSLRSRLARLTLAGLATKLESQTLALSFPVQPPLAS